MVTYIVCNGFECDHQCQAKDVLSQLFDILSLYVAVVLEGVGIHCVL